MDSSEMRSRSRMLNALSRSVRNGILDPSSVSQEMQQLLDSKRGWSPIQFPSGVKEEIQDMLAGSGTPLWESLYTAVQIHKYLKDKGALEKVSLAADEHITTMKIQSVKL